MNRYPHRKYSITVVFEDGDTNDDVHEMLENMLLEGKVVEVVTVKQDRVKPVVAPSAFDRWVERLGRRTS